MDVYLINTKGNQPFMAKTNKKKSGKSSHKDLLKGRLEISKSGMGFVIVEGEEKDIMIKPHSFGTAFHGDTVMVELDKYRVPGRRTEGIVVEVIARKQMEFIGNLHVNRKIAFFVPSGDKGVPDFFIPPDKLNNAVDGDKVLVRLLKWDRKDKKPEGEIVTVLKAEDESDMAMKTILAEAGFPLEFSKEVLKEAESLDPLITDEELERRRDCRDILTFTIDPVDARDFDDALSVRQLENGNYEIGVHIADVSHFVKQGGILDLSAYERATSVYLPDRVNPMLPEKISNELCSLRPHEDKYTFSVIFEITPGAEIRHKWIGRTVIHSNHRFTYEEVQQIIESGKGLHEKEILLFNQLAQKFRKERISKGAINFTSQEVRFILDEKGKPVGVMIKESKEAHQLIEEFMLLANRAVAEYVSGIKWNKKPVPFPYRIHDTPDEEKLKPFVAFAKKFGHGFDMKDEFSIAASFNRLLKDVEGKPEQHVLEQLGIRTMAKAVYTSENIGHYGLGFEHYCHFTSPIRRYPDVLVHRILQQCLDKETSPDKKMEEKCKHCSERERAAMESERASNKYKQVEYMRQFLGEEFDGVISGVASFGFWVETIEHKCEGLVSIRDLNLYDDFRHEESEYALIGLGSKRKFRMGDKVRIRVVAGSLERRQLDYEWVTDLLPRNAGKSKKKK
jgi:ribonuclease R